ncbi:hypothetical protein [Raoultella ornithinolytica]|uniref:hypothetical protein n=1 Tax=Raoultella ornithinolytica TaxID=54291 RepID=UPI001F32E94A|nr:hypothetical protein [Raoultella ornithinolytica]MCE9799948.1 hypothetical protein [Raoultella ornithinolytica]MCE9809855.1 hypothetical protein [Raoultella ornithinolytica]MCE9866718.1 hypothetical protein [Raoultella ornithinolytica]
MSIYFNEHGSAIGYQVEGRWKIKGDYLQIEHGPNIPGGLYKINDNKVKFPLDYKEVEGVIDTEKLTFTVCGTVYKMIKPSEPFAIPVRFPT